MAIDLSSLLKKGFTPLAANRFASVSWQGEHIGEFWMWNGQFTESSIQTMKVTDLKEAAIRCWRDKWVPLKWDSSLLRRMEASLRSHRGLQQQGVVFPDTPFLPEPMAIPSEYITPEIRKFM